MVSELETKYFLFVPRSPSRCFRAYTVDHLAGHVCEAPVQGEMNTKMLFEKDRGQGNANGGWSWLIRMPGKSSVRILWARCTRYTSDDPSSETSCQVPSRTSFFLYRLHYTGCGMKILVHPFKKTKYSLMQLSQCLLLCPIIQCCPP